MLTKFREGGVYKNRLGEYTVKKLMEDGKHMEVFCNYDGGIRKFDKLIAQLVIYNIQKEAINAKNI